MGRAKISHLNHYPHSFELSFLCVRFAEKTFAWFLAKKREPQTGAARFSPDSGRHHFKKSQT